MVAVTMRTNRFGKKYCKVVLTGGACAGKTVATAEIKEFVEKNHGNEWQVFTVSEASTVLYSGGVSRDELSRTQLAQWQTDMLVTIFRLEDVYENIAINEPKRHTLIICDRGGMDPKVFTPPDIWLVILDRMRMTEEEIMDRYDKVILLQTAPRSNYTLGNNKCRREDYETAAIVNKQYGEVWKNHRALADVKDNEKDCWRQKVRVLLVEYLRCSISRAMNALLLAIALVFAPALADISAGDQKVGDNDHLLSFDACKEDIHKHCNHDGVDLKSDMSILECLQDAGQTETAVLTAACETLVWQFKVKLTQDERFSGAAKQYCGEEMKKLPGLGKCAELTQPGFALSCMLDFVANVTKTTDCHKFLARTERLAFSDFRLIGPFVTKCSSSIERLGCGTLTPHKAHQGVRVPHTQGMALECLIDKVVKATQNNQDPLTIVDNECRHEVMRLAEMQSDDFHLDRPLFFACRHDREKFCKEVEAGNGKVFECLLLNRNDQQMEPECTRILSERAHLMGRDYRMAHPLTKACETEMKAYRCEPQSHLEAAAHFHLSWILLCLENVSHNNKEVQPPSQACQHEMMNHRQLMLSEFRMSPEVVMTCAKEIDSYCSPRGDIEMEGKTMHCLMEHAQARDEKKQIGPQCMQAIGMAIKVADIGSNYKVDKVLHASCRPLIEGKCAQDADSESATLQCLMKHVDTADMTDECEKRLLEVQYFMARDWTLDPKLYESCHDDAVKKCSALENWHMTDNQKNEVDPGPQVLACLYRSAYDELNPLSVKCSYEVRRVLRDRAVRVNLIPDVEIMCRDALSEYCSANIEAGDEMQCLQDNFESKEFMKKHKSCYDQVKHFTEMESKDTKLNRALSKACKPVIETHCMEFANEEIDNGDVMECLLANKDASEMTGKCRSYVNHFELVSLRDYHFSNRFQKACANDIQKSCPNHGNDKAEIIRSLSEVVFEHRVLGNKEDLSKECRRQLRVAYLQQEQVEQFDDKEHMKDADPQLMTKCANELRQFRCDQKDTFEDTVECLRMQFDGLGPDCKSMIFSREKIEAADNSMDDELQKSCKFDIGKYCRNSEPERVLDCLGNTKIQRLLQKGCHAVVQERLRESAKDIRLRPGLMIACKEEAKLHCAEEYAKVNNPQYAQKTLEGVVVGCLREKFRQTGHDRIHLGAQCRHEISTLIVESEFDAQMDPLLYKACKNTISQHCSASVIQRGGHFENVIECLKADFYSGAISDRECAQQLARHTQETLVDIHLDPVLHEACALDVQRLCRDVPPGQSRVIMCLMDASEDSNSRMSQTCKTKLTERNKLWMRAHQDYKMELPDNFEALVNVVMNHPQKLSLLGWFAGFVFILFLVGCCCGRVTKRAARELKNR